MIDGGPDPDRIFGDSENDQINGSSGDDELHGGPGLDIITGSTGDDVIYGDGMLTRLMVDWESTVSMVATGTTTYRLYLHGQSLPGASITTLSTAMKAMIR